MRCLSPLPRAIALAAALLLAACQPRPVSEPAAVAAAHAWPPYDYAVASDRDRPVFHLDPERTRIDIVVRRDGPLARFGHDHVLSVLDAEGYLLLAEAEDGSRADLRFAVERLQIDAADARQRHGLDAGPDAAAIDGTRDNLMQSVLDPVQWPWVTVSLQSFSRQGDHWSADVVIDINGQRSSSRQPFKLQREKETVTVEGLVVLRQTHLGLQPFAALGGGLRVADPIEVHFYLYGAERSPIGG
jgi:hypothetical protein